MHLTIFFNICRVLAYVQIGTFIIVLMCTSWFFATFFLQACLHILGPSAFNADSIPQDTCCGQRIKQKKKKQRETWQPKVALKEDTASNGREAATLESPYLPASTSPNHHQFLNEMPNTPVNQTNSFSRNAKGK